MNEYNKKKRYNEGDEEKKNKKKIFNASIAAITK